MEDPANRSRLAKLLRFYSSHDDKMIFLSEYVERMKPKQDKIYYIAGANKAEVYIYFHGKKYMREIVVFIICFLF